MHGIRHRLSTVVIVLAAATLALSIVPAASGDDWGRDAAGSAAFADLDPAIRTAIVARSAPAPTTVGAAPSLEQGFDWAAAGVGLGAGIAVMFVGIGCVTLARSHGRVRSV